jgi:hypothetical protein
MSKNFKGYFAFGLYIAVLLALYLFRVRRQWLVALRWSDCRSVVGLVGHDSLQ